LRERHGTSTAGRILRLVPASNHDGSYYDSMGRYRSKVTMPGYHKGRAPANKGRTMPPEILTQEEVAALMESVAGDSPVARRNHAMLGLMYGAELKIGQVLSLAPRDYDSQRGTLTVRAARRHRQSSKWSVHEVRLDPGARRLLDDWMVARGKLRLRGAAPLFCTLIGSRGGALAGSSVRNLLSTKGRALGIQKRVSPDGLRASRARHRDSESGRFEASIASYINAEAFRAQYPVAHLKWSDAHQLLEIAPDRHATTIGHLCREAINAFSDELIRHYSLDRREVNKTKAKIRAVFSAQEGMSRSVRTSLEALLAYWETVSDLAQRQEHGGNLAAEDSRRLVFQTMLVMREIDLALSRG
jgi:hypothetical protein